MAVLFKITCATKGCGLPLVQSHKIPGYYWQHEDKTKDHGHTPVAQSTKIGPI